MFCKNCGKEVHPQAVACPGCGVPPLLEKKYCQNCGIVTQPNQALCTKCGSALVLQAPVAGDKNKIAAGLFGIFLGGLGIHKFYLGYTKEGVTTLLISVLTCGVGWCVMHIIGFIEGIIYLTQTDEEFNRFYVQGHKGWF
jgi:TM2 domain-containing membrane protein YozV/RNA polymerase subunit RPABC4/transcription elongation factor Spt4